MKGSLRGALKVGLRPGVSWCGSRGAVPAWEVVPEAWEGGRSEGHQGVASTWPVGGGTGPGRLLRGVGTGTLHCGCLPCTWQSKGPQRESVQGRPTALRRSAVADRAAAAPRDAGSAAPGHGQPTLRFRGESRGGRVASANRWARCACFLACGVGRGLVRSAEARRGPRSTCRPGAP